MAATLKMADLVLMLRLIQGDSLYTYEQFGVDRKLYVEVKVKALMLDGEGKKWFPLSRPLKYVATERF